MIASVRFQTAGKLYDFHVGDEDDLKPGDFVLVDTSRGQQMGELAELRFPRSGEDVSRLKPIMRRATGRDLALRQILQRDAEEALEIAQEWAAEMRLPIKLIDAEYTFDRQRLTFVYVTEAKKYNLSELTRRLGRRFSSRVELRRVGPRDHAKLLDGYGPCGGPRCCARFLPGFTPVSIKMAKLQGVSLNPSEITGMCGRLRCCLTFEEEQYREASKRMPRRKKRVKTPLGEGKVIDLLPLQGLVVVQIEDRRVEVPVEDVELVRR